LSNWQENSDRLKSDAAKLRKIKTQAKLPNGGTYTICQPGTAEGACGFMQMLRPRKVTGNTAT